MENIDIRMDFKWKSPQKIAAQTFICGYCNCFVSSDLGYELGSNSHNPNPGIYICPRFWYPTFIGAGFRKYPNHPFGRSVSNLPKDIELLYEEARKCTGHGCYTAAVLSCRKILMHIAVSKGADEGISFAQYVEQLSATGYIQPDGKDWVDHIRNKGNEANHDITIMSQREAEVLLTFTEMLLKFVYEFPSLMLIQEKNKNSNYLWHHSDHG